MVPGWRGREAGEGGGGRRGKEGESICGVTFIASINFKIQNFNHIGLSLSRTIVNTVWSSGAKSYFCCS